MPQITMRPSCESSPLPLKLTVTLPKLRDKAKKMLSSFEDIVMRALIILQIEARTKSENNDCQDKNIKCIKYAV